MIGFDVLLIAVLFINRGRHTRQALYNLPAKCTRVFDVHGTVIKGFRIRPIP